MRNTTVGIGEIMAKNLQTKNKELSTDKKAVLNRLSRIVGQINGVKKMVEEGRECGDILIQMMAISSSIKSTQRTIFENYFEEELARKDQEGDKVAVEKLKELLKRI